MVQGLRCRRRDAPFQSGPDDRGEIGAYRSTDRYPERGIEPPLIKVLIRSGLLSLDEMTFG